MSQPLQLLQIEDSKSDAALIVRLLEKSNYTVKWKRVETAEELRAALIQQPWDIIISDYSLPQFNASAALAILQHSGLDIPFIVVSGTVGETIAVTLMKNGAQDYLMKDHLMRLVPAVTRELAEARNRQERRQAEQERLKLLSILEQSLNEIYLFDAQTLLFQYVNDCALRNTGHTLAQMQTKTLLHLNPQFYAEAFHKMTAPLRQAGQNKIIFETHHMRADGSTYPVEVHLQLATSGQRNIFLAVVNDITERKHAETRIMRLNRIHAVLSGINTTIVRVRDRQELFTEACRIAVEHGQFRMVWIGWLDPKEMKIVPVAKEGVDDGYLEQIQLTVRGETADEYAPVARALREKSPVIYNNISSDAEMTRWHFQSLQRDYHSMVAFPLLVSDKVVGVFVLYAAETGFFDTEEIKLLSELAGDVSFALDYIEKAERLNYLAYYDVLTGLPSRILFQDRLNHALNQASRYETDLALLFLDLDDFKNINDSLGHNTGDLLLKQLATRLTACVREGDTVARLGGDEFVVVLAEIAVEEDISLVAQKIIKLITEPFIVDSHELFVTCSVGIALYPKDGEDSQTLLKNADAALYQAKSQGRNNAQFCTAEMNAKALERLTLENSLRQALKREEFLLHYQPRVDLRSGLITGVEALVRWQQKPGLQLVPPGKFIPIAEDCGLIVPIGVWVLHTACAQNKAWQQAGLKPVCVAVNLSARQFRQQDLVEVVSRVLQETGLDPTLLELELTESLIMQNVNTAIDTLTQLKDMGVKLSIDDFGTGYSSLSYLKRFPIDFLKIDQSFVRDITTDKDDAAIAKTIISMSHDMELKVIAEGVETEAQESFLRQYHCDEMQGYFFSKPVPATGIASLLKH
ncbi:MAG: EAL domain-containing protein [Gallionellaceae bacterium]|nr:EAL domain-containing protein [Gallionellaceae bacterium]